MVSGKGLHGLGSSLWRGEQRALPGMVGDKMKEGGRSHLSSLNSPWAHHKDVTENHTCHMVCETCLYHVLCIPFLELLYKLLHTGRLKQKFLVSLSWSQRSEMMMLAELVPSKGCVGESVSYLCPWIWMAVFPPPRPVLYIVFPCA